MSANDPKADIGVSRWTLQLANLRNSGWFVYRHDEPGLTRDEDGMRLAVTAPLPTPQEAFTEARKIVDNKVEGPRK
jgi:hypothetical protein